MTPKPRDDNADRRPRDSDPSDMTDFEKSATTEELKKDLPADALRTPDSAEGERNPDDQSR